MQVFLDALDDTAYMRFDIREADGVRAIYIQKQSVEETSVSVQEASIQGNETIRFIDCPYKLDGDVSGLRPSGLGSVLNRTQPF